MAERIEIRTVTVAAGVLQSAPTETDLTFNDGIVERIEIVIPSGHVGLTGLAIAQAHQIIIPASGNTWIIGENVTLSWEVENYSHTGSWSAFMFNTGKFSHSWQIRFHVRELPVHRPPSHRMLLPAHLIDLSAGSGRHAIRLPTVEEMVRAGS